MGLTDLDRDHLTAFVKAARWADPVRDVRRGALGTGAQLRKRQDTVIRPAHTLAATRRFSFGNTHNYFNFKLFSSAQAILALR
jgi:hypothetical protein